MASGSALNTSGLTTLPSCMGAMVKPFGVRSRAMFWACAFLLSASSASSLPERNCSSMAPAADLVVFAFEARRQHAAQLVERRDHAFGQRARAAMRQLQRLRAVGVFEIVDVGPVGRGRGFGRLGPQMRLHRRGLAGGRRPQHEHIEVVAFDVDAELDGLQRAFLADQAGGRQQLVGGLEAQRGCGDDAAKFRGLERLTAVLPPSSIRRWR